MSEKSCGKKFGKSSVKTLSIAQIAESESRDYDTVYRWITEGYRGVYLRAKKLGKCWSVLVEDLEQFREACNAAGSDSIVGSCGDGGPVPAASRSARKSGKGPTLEQRAEKAKEKLKKMGL
jgi:hypothetical protein